MYSLCIACVGSSDTDRINWLHFVSHGGDLKLLEEEDLRRWTENTKGRESGPAYALRWSEGYASLADPTSSV